MSRNPLKSGRYFKEDRFLSSNKKKVDKSRNPLKSGRYFKSGKEYICWFNKNNVVIPLNRVGISRKTH